MISAWILRLLRSLPDLEVHQPEGVDVESLAMSARGGQVVTFIVYERHAVSEERALSLVEASHVSPHPMLLATNRLAPRTRSLLDAHGVSSVERVSGRCHLRGPGLLVEVVTRDDNASRDGMAGISPRPPALLRDKSGLIAEALLSRDHSEPIALQDVAHTTGLSRGLVSRLLSRLTKLEILDALGSAPRKRWLLRDPGALLDRWTEEERAEAEEITPLSVWSRSADALLGQLPHIAEIPSAYAVGGAAAANLYAPTLTAQTSMDVWISADVPASEVAKRLRGDIVSSGANLRVLQTAGDASIRLAEALPSTVAGPQGLRVVSPYRAYVEASRSTGRGPDVANALRELLRLGSPRPAKSVND